MAVLTSDVSKHEIRLSEVREDPGETNIVLSPHELDEGAVTHHDLSRPLVQTANLHLRSKHLHREVSVVSPTQEM